MSDVPACDRLPSSEGPGEGGGGMMGGGGRGGGVMGEWVDG